MPLFEVVIVSDDSDNEYMGDNFQYNSEDSDIMVLSVSSPPPEPPASSQPTSSHGGGSSRWDAEYDSYHSDVEFMDPGALISASQTQASSINGSQRTGIPSGSGSQQLYHSNADMSPGDRKRKNPTYSSDANESDDSLMIEVQKKSTKRRAKSEEEKAIEKAEKEAQKQAKKDESKRKKEEAASKNTEQKLANKARKDANKLVIDKKKTLKDMTVELSSGLVTTSLSGLLTDKMREFECAVQPLSESVVRNSITNCSMDLNALDIKLIRWKRRVVATFDEQQRSWIPLAAEQHYTRTEGTYLIYVTGDDVMRSLSCNPSVPSLSQQVRVLRDALGPKHHIHLMLCGWRSRNAKKDVKEHVERTLVGLQVREGLFVEQVPDEEEAVNWIYNMSADLGIKPHKLIERSHLPFCAQASSAFKVGKSDTDTMTKMLAQLPRLTDPAAKAVVKEYGTINRLMEAYEQAERRGDGPMMLANVVVPRTRTGKDAPRVLNKALSERLHNVMWGSDPKALVN